MNPVLRKLSVLSRAPHRALAAKLSDSTDKKKGYLEIDDDFLDYDDDNETFLEEPPKEALQQRRRRRALVPPKLITDGYESAAEFDDKQSKSSANNTNNVCSSQTDDGGDVAKSTQSNESCTLNVPPNVTIDSVDDDGVKTAIAEHPTGAEQKKPPSTSQEIQSQRQFGSSSSSSSNHLNVNRVDGKNRRRSSVVVIPPMQICPGDLLVYSKVLSQRSNMIGEAILKDWEGFCAPLGIL